MYINLQIWSLNDSKFYNILLFLLNTFLLTACGGGEVLNKNNIDIEKKIEITQEKNKSNDFIIKPFEILDPLYEKQWYLHKKSGINISSVWKEYKGDGISIAVIDSGIEAIHPDLQHNIDLIHSFRYSDESSDPTPTIKELNDPYVDAPHGTCVAGVIAASQNDIGISGIAPNATLVGLNVFSRPDDSAFENALMYPNVDISSNSWGGDLSFGLNDDQISLDAIITKMLTDPIIYIFAAGNESSNSGFSSVLNSRYTLVVGATTDKSIIAPYSNHGANILCVAPGGGELKSEPKIVTTDLIGDIYGYDVKGDHFDIFENQNYEYTNNFNGSSAATPIVSAIIALMLEANKDLNYRDIKYIIAHSSKKIDPNHTSWIKNSANLYFSRYYGFGLIDAQKAVNMAKDFKSLDKEIIISKKLDELNITIPDNNQTGIELELKIDQNISLEYASLEINTNHSYSGDLKIVLTSATNTSSVLTLGNTITEDPYLPWEFGSICFMDEYSKGVWKVHISDISKNDIGTLKSIKLTLYGDVK
jgi:hypothetical protein